jgi:hypothetical protein
MAAQAEQGLTTYAGPQALTTAPTDWGEIETVFAQMVQKNATSTEVRAAMVVCKALGFNPILNHINLIDKQVYVTHKGLLNLAHRSGVFDGIEVLEEGETQTHWIARVAVYRKDMSRPFVYSGRYSKQARNKQYGQEMAVTRAECMALRRAFDVGIPIYEEINWNKEERGTVTVIEAAPREQEVIEATVVPTPTILTDREFAQFLHDIAQQAHDGIASADILKLLQTYNNHLSPDQHALTGKLWTRIKAARKAGEPWPAPAPLDEDVAEIGLADRGGYDAPQPTTAAELAASDDPFGDRVQPVSYAG